MTQTTLWYLNDKDKDFEAMNKRLAQGSFFANSDNYPNFALEAKVSNQKLPISNNDVQFNIYEYSFDGPYGDTNYRHFNNASNAKKNWLYS
ncbi:hypothetical protein C1A34_01435 [Lactobacillus amylovorus]|nr:hypothetical protein C1A34_01435 [Lactobacillus amylovorus]